MGNWSFCCIQRSSEIVASRSSIRFGDLSHNKPGLLSDLESQQFGRRIQIVIDKCAVSCSGGCNFNFHILQKYVNVSCVNSDQ